jgi:hypothetical protein
MNKLWIFGCSHSTGDFNLSSGDKPWTTIVATAMGRLESNYAVSGNSNDRIVESVMSAIPQFSADDKIIVLMTHPYRIDYGNKVLKPSNMYDEWWYKVVIDDKFYATKQLHQLLSLHGLLANFDYSIGFADPTLLFAMTKENKNVKQYFTKNCFIFPKLQLPKSYPLGDDMKHLSPAGHIDIAKFIISKVVV